MKMDGKTVLITGSTDGVGRYVAATLAAAGAKVLIHGRDRARAKNLADEIRRQGHTEPTFYPRICHRWPEPGNSPKRFSPTMGGSTSSSAMPGSVRARRVPSARPALTGTSCASR
jgi:NAD(P)-dependent dehydrogenase (short-subunit alcohol dehydrogenase family)